MKIILRYLSIRNTTRMAREPNVILLFCLFGLISIGEPAKPITLEEVTVTRQQAVEALNKIQPENALPLVLYKDNENKPQLPSELKTVAIIDGKMAHGTMFFSQASSNQMFFCPNKKSKTNCLVNKHFRRNELLKCDAEVIPRVEYLNSDCGADGTGHLYKLFYEICDSRWNRFNPNEVDFYNICYDENKQESLYTHHIIISPQLLNSRLLFREREVNYDLRYDLKLAKDEAAKSNNELTEQKSDSLQRSPNAAYKDQKLVPAEDMALALWRKTTFQHANTALQHEKLINLWNEICQHIRSRALYSYNNNIIKTEIYSGIIDVDFKPTQAIENQIYNIWVKLIYYYYNDTSQTKSSQHYDGIVILMNNFLDKKNDEVTSLDSEKKLIDEYCLRDSCVEYLSNKFQEIRGNIRCCPVTEKILKHFNRKEDTEIEVSDILNLTKNRETLYDKNLSDEYAEYSIGKVEPNEVLPLILLTHPSHYSLHVPFTVGKIELKNRRIMHDSGFYALYYTITLYFCPKAGNDEKCLAPVQFNESKPLECSEEVVPVIQPLPEDENQCGGLIDEGGTLHRVVYKICPAEEPYTYTTTELKIYEFCYSKKKQKILYTSHRITSTKLLFSKLLIREREVQYVMQEDAEFPLSSISQFKDPYTGFLTHVNKNAIGVSHYEPQKLVSPEDMAFASWRKTTFKYINVELQHKKLIPLWNDINRCVREYAHEWNIENLGDENNYPGISIHTGVLDIPLALQKNINAPKTNIWIKIIYHDTSLNPTGVAILMNNFIVWNNDKSESKNSKGNVLKKYCEKNLCAQVLQNKFAEVGGLIRCCPLTGDILQLFNIPSPKMAIEVLRIPNIVGISNS